MASVGMTHDQIALCLGDKGIAAKTLRKHFKRELETSVIRTNALCGVNIVKAMKEGQAWALCFWAKTRMGWKERSPLEDISQLTIKRVIGVADSEI